MTGREAMNWVRHPGLRLREEIASDFQLRKGMSRENALAEATRLIEMWNRRYQASRND
jgi:hypothetical protein